MINELQLLKLLQIDNPEGINDALLKKHLHANKAILDKFSVNEAGVLLYNGEPVSDSHTNATVLASLSFTAEGKLQANGADIPTSANSVTLTKAIDDKINLEEVIHIINDKISLGNIIELSSNQW